MQDPMHTPLTKDEVFALGRELGCDLVMTAIRSETAEQRANQHRILRVAAIHIVALTIFNVEKQEGPARAEECERDLYRKIQAEINFLRNVPADELTWFGPDA